MLTSQTGQAALIRQIMLWLKGGKRMLHSPVTSLRFDQGFETAQENIMHTIQHF